MEILYSCLLGFFLFLGIYLLYNNKSNANANLPPGKAGFPIIGETLEFLYAGWKGNSKKFITDRIAKYSSNVFKTNLFGSQFVVFWGVDAHRFLFANENKLVRVWYPPSVHKIMSLSSKTFSAEKVIDGRLLIEKFMKPSVKGLQSPTALADTLAHHHFVTHWENKDTVSVYPLAKRYALSLACRMLISIDDPNLVAIFENAIASVVRGAYSVPIDLPGTQLNRGIKASSVIQKELLVIIKQRKIDLAKGTASPTQDVLSHMLSTSNAKENIRDDTEIAHYILGLLVASIDNIAAVCSSVVKYLAELHEVYQGVYREQLEIVKSKASSELNWEDIQKMKYSWNVAREALRLHPLSQGSLREALTDFTYNGFLIPKGCKICFSAQSTHSDHELFPEPQKFDPTRFEGSGPPPFAYIPFGGGARMCPGREFGRLGILVFMHHLVKGFRFEKLIPDHEKIVYTPLANPEKGLPIRLFPCEAQFC